MERFKLNNWFIKENELTIILKHFYVVVYPISCNNKVSFVLNISDDENNKTLYFDTLEESVKFAEEEITGCNNFIEIAEKYKEHLENPKRYIKK